MLLLFSWKEEYEPYRSYLSVCLQTINEWTFDVFSVNEFTSGQCLRYVGFELMQRYNLPNKLHVKRSKSFPLFDNNRWLSMFKQISITALQNFLEQMESGYSKYRNPYHNLIHAADVLQTTYQIIYNSGLMVEVNGVSMFKSLLSFCENQPILILVLFCLYLAQLDLDAL